MGTNRLGCAHAAADMATPLVPACALNEPYYDRNTGGRLLLSSPARDGALNCHRLMQVDYLFVCAACLAAAMMQTVCAGGAGLKSNGLTGSVVKRPAASR